MCEAVPDFSFLPADDFRLVGQYSGHRSGLGDLRSERNMPPAERTPSFSLRNPGAQIAAAGPWTERPLRRFMVVVMRTWVERMLRIVSGDVFGLKSQAHAISHAIERVSPWSARCVRGSLQDL